MLLRLAYILTAAAHSRIYLRDSDSTIWVKLPLLAKVTTPTRNKNRTVFARSQRHSLTISMFTLIRSSHKSRQLTSQLDYPCLIDVDYTSSLLTQGTAGDKSFTATLPKEERLPSPSAVSGRLCFRVTAHVPAVPRPSCKRGLPRKTKFDKFLLQDHIQLKLGLS